MDVTGFQLSDGSRVGVIGGGPAGSFFSFFLLDMAERVGMDVGVDIFEPRDFTRPGPAGCNMCGGIISESLVQNLATEGIILPTTVVQRGIDSYMLHMDVGSVRIDTPLQEKRIGAVHRGPGPRDIREIKWGSFDGHLLSLAQKKGCKVIPGRVDGIEWVDGRPQVRTRGEEPQAYDLLAIATGVNSAAHRLVKDLNISYEPPETTKTYIQEYFMGEEMIAEVLGTSMHVFLLDLPRLEFAAIIPKGDYVSVCMLGEDIDNELIGAFLNSPEVKQCFPSDWDMELKSCNCSPRISVKGATQPFADRLVFIGDIGVTRLYKDGIGAAYRTAKAAATTAVFQGVSAADFKEHYWPTCKRIETDNMLGKIIFFVTRQIQRRRFARRAVLRMTANEQQRAGQRRPMSTVLWDTFTGSAPYQEILLRTFHPAFWARFIGDLAISLFGRSDGERSDKEAIMDKGAIGKIYEDGEVIIRQGDVGDCMYVIQAGQVEVIAERGDQEVRLAVRYEGEFFGEMAIFEREVRSATVRALGRARVLTVDKKNFLRRIHEDPSLAMRLVETMSSRIRESSEEISRLKGMEQGN